MKINNYILLLFSCVSGLMFAEGIVRIFNLAPKLISNIGYFRVVDNPKIVYEFIPGSPVDGGIINQQGFKDDDFVLGKKPDLVRIAMLGDSITQGIYVGKDKTFSSKLEQMLNRRAIEKQNRHSYEVMNFGVGGYNLLAEVETLKTKVLQYCPDIVVLNFFQNDDEPLPGLYAFFLGGKKDFEEKEIALFLRKYLFREKYASLSYMKSWLYKSKLYIFLLDRTNRLKKNFPVADLDEGRVFYEQCREIKKLKDKYGFKFLVCMHPDFIYGHSGKDKKMADISGLFGFASFYMLDYYRAETVSLESLQVKKDDPAHPNELGHLIIAKSIFNELYSNGFIDVDAN